MAHKVETMAFAGETPWHGIGTKVEGENVYDVVHAIQAAGLDWEVEMVPTFLADGRQVLIRNACVRKTDRAILGTGGPDWTPLQNAQAFAWAKPFLDARQASIECAGALEGGRRVFLLLKLALDPQDIVAGDPVLPYVLLSDVKDGGHAVKVGFVAIRVVCWNTLSAATGDASSKLIRVFHNARVVETLDKVRETMDLARQRFEITAQQYRMLARAGCSESDLRKYVVDVFDFATQEDGSVKGKAAQVADRIVDLSETGRGYQTMRGTWWGAYNAVTEYLGYEAGNKKTTQEGRLGSLWFGRGQRINDRALELAVDTVTAAAS